MFFKRISQNYLDNTGVVNNRNDDDNDAFHPLHVYLSSLENQVELAKIDIRQGKMKKNQFEHSTYLMLY